jgi:GrpB-like predicted nucleotidyltransferase (UPF0157 family)
MTLGLPPGENYLVPHDPEWAALFEDERAKLRAVLPAEAMDIQHVGSTAVPGIQAKPIIDIAIAARRYMMADEWQDRMASIGYDYPGDIGIPDHRIYGRDRLARIFLVHVVDADGMPWRGYIRFRDRLRSDRAMAMEYEALKLSAAREHPIGRDLYTRFKASFIDTVLSSR